ncbi:MAG: hypothetical protein BRD55_10695 [Bacteroidetes bacterium SW_9_63_38]|nr:MAG: hypothetical protein BRD55_10695 [Bacteroidetes bacterium SW_9_63_38]
MLKFFSDENLSETQARNLANTVERSTEIINKRYIEIKKVFFTVGCKFDLNKFIRVSTSMFSMLVIDNIKKRGYYNEEEAIEAFIEEIDEGHLLYVDIDSSFDAEISDREGLKREAAIWAAEKYFEEEPSRKQSNLFYERAKKFVDYIENSDAKSFE